MIQRVPLREGYPFAMTLRYTAGIDARYTKGQFVIREKADPAARAIVECDDESGLSIDHDADQILISVSGITTDDLGVNDRSLPCWGEVRL